MSILSEPHFHCEAAAVERLEAIVWPNGPVCPKCGGLRSTAINGKTARPGLRSCTECRQQFRVTVGTIFERSHVPLHKWFQAAHLLASSKKGISAHQLHRTLQVTYKTAWFMEHRLREAMNSGETTLLGGGMKAVEVDETFLGRKKGRTKKRGYGHTMKVMSLIERGGAIRSVVLDTLNNREVARIIRENVRSDSKLMTDSAAYYASGILSVEKHEMVNHNAGEYVRGDVHVNTLEGYFSIFKRGMKGVYQHCSEKHLHRYLAEFDFRYNNRTAMGVSDGPRAEKALRGIVGKRLMYRDSSPASISGQDN